MSRFCVIDLFAGRNSLTKIDSNGIYTGTLNANQITTGSLIIGGSTGGNTDGSIVVYDTTNSVLFSANKAGAQIAGFKVAGLDLVATAPDGKILKLNGSTGSLSFLGTDKVERVSITSLPVTTLTKLITPDTSAITTLPARATNSETAFEGTFTSKPMYGGSTNETFSANFSFNVIGTNVPISVKFNINNAISEVTNTIISGTGEINSVFHFSDVWVILYSYNTTTGVYTLVSMSEATRLITYGPVKGPVSSSVSLNLTVPDSSAVYRLGITTSTNLSQTIVSTDYNGLNEFIVRTIISSYGEISSASWSTASYSSSIGDRSLSVFYDSSKYLHVANSNAEFIQANGGMRLNNNFMQTVFLQFSALGTAGYGLTINRCIGNALYTAAERAKLKVERTGTGKYTITHNLGDLGLIANIADYEMIGFTQYFWIAYESKSMNTITIRTQDDSTANDVANIFVQFICTRDWYT